ncbi:response regulator [Vibrio hangzhouensis]|uniref:Putative two-component system response regulator n=1 Tax=Vibrio hangzhouensis TaxID=462991 RepID=A0A1H5XXL8_9VIBR|nr:two-component system response regulator [Vibrio hangzhouensis]SEG16362.1 putative two-component system response regulator [Vibrio hangzhouensis]
MSAEPYKDDRFTVLVVDDTPENLDVLNGILSDSYRVKVAINGRIALKIAERTPKPDIILLDVMMPEMDGYEVCQTLKLNPLTRDIPVIFVTAKSQVEDETRGFKLGAVDYIIKPVSPPIVRARVAAQLALHHQKRQLEREVQKRTEDIKTTQREIIHCLGRASEYKDNETGMHVVRMSHYSRLLAEKIGADPKWVELLYEAAPMHDVGKIGIADSVLLKTDRLDSSEWNEMQRHVEYGVAILGKHSSPLIDLAKEVALYHHEKWDGSGYPRGIAGKAIPLSARIVAIADVFDALTSERPYKAAWNTADAFDYLCQQSGQHFEPQLVEVFISLESEIEKIKRTFADEAVGQVMERQ